MTTTGWLSPAASLDAPDDRASVGQEDSRLVPESDKETVRQAWEEVRDLGKQLGNGLRDGAGPRHPVLSGRGALETRHSKL